MDSPASDEEPAFAPPPDLTDFGEAEDLRRLESIPRLYHYTSAEGVLGFFTKERVRATSAEFLSDGQEIREAFGLFSKMLRERAPSLTEYARPQLEGFSRWIDTGEVYSFEPLQRRSMFVFCVSERDDVLSQWRAYCPPEGGYSVGLAVEYLTKHAERPLTFRKVVYDPAAQRALLQPLVEHFVYYAEHGDAMLPESILDHLWRVAPLIKNKGFEEEQEWRLFLHGSIGENVEFAPGRTGLKPYIWVPLDPMAVFAASCTVGPHVDQARAARIVEMLSIQKYGHPIMTHIKRSSTPFRAGL